MPQQQHNRHRALGTGSCSATMRRNAQATSGARPATDDPAEVMEPDLPRSVHSARISMAECLSKRPPAGRPGGAVVAHIARPSGSRASHRRPNHRTKHVHHRARGSLRQGRKNRFGDGRLFGLRFGPGTLGATPPSDRRPGSVVGFQCGLLDGPKDVVQCVSTFLPTAPTLHEHGRRRDGFGQR